MKNLQVIDTVYKDDPESNPLLDDNDVGTITYALQQLWLDSTTELTKKDLGEIERKMHEDFVTKSKRLLKILD